MPIEFGHPQRHFRQTDSTNARARELAESGAPGGMVVTAESQSAGRGRQGRTWFAPPGGALLYSALLRPLGQRPLLPLAVPVAVCAAAESLADVSCAVKWPNDVWVAERKLAGVLIESRPGPHTPAGEAEEVGGGRDGWAIIGIGLNLAVEPEAFPPELRETATSLAGEADFSTALSAINRELTRWVEADAEAVLAEFRRRDALEGRRISWQGGSGVAGGVDDAGHLLVGTSEGQVALGAGEVHLAVGEAEEES
jgi:BirA family transcriptional regulator, biotin operon repressor / biotin---[acetyl-CoA-carboxylase] ligase